MPLSEDGHSQGIGFTMLGSCFVCIGAILLPLWAVIRIPTQLCTGLGDFAILIDFFVNGCGMVPPYELPELPEPFPKVLQMPFLRSLFPDGFPLRS